MTTTSSDNLDEILRVETPPQQPHLPSREEAPSLEESLMFRTTTPLERPTWAWETRHTFAVMSFLGLANVYAMRVNLSVAIVAMINHTVTPHPAAAYGGVIHSDEIANGEFNWTPKQQGIILGSFFYGYVVTQIPGGILAEKFGGKWLFGGGTLITAIFTLLTPVAARAGFGWLVTVRIIEGLGEGVTFPSLHAMVAKWIPAKEKTRLGTLTFIGAPAGTVISMPISGLLAYSLGWESIFYIFGCLGCFWFIFWSVLVFSSPMEHPGITLAEKSYITSQTGSSNRERNLPFPPLCQIMSSIPVFAITVAHMGQNWGFYTLLTETPTYLQNILNIPLKQNGFISALPYLMQIVASMAFGSLSDYLTNNGKLSKLAARKTFNTIGQVGPAIALAILGFVSNSKVLAIICLCLASGLNGATYSGFQFNHIDLSPNYAGTLMGLTNTFGNVCGFVSPYVAGAILEGQQSPLEAWRTIFLLASGIYVAFNAVFVIFGQVEVQPWNTYWEQPDQDDDETQPILGNVIQPSQTVQDEA